MDSSVEQLFAGANLRKKKSETVKISAKKNPESQAVEAWGQTQPEDHYLESGRDISFEKKLELLQEGIALDSIVWDYVRHPERFRQSQVQQIRQEVHATGVSWTWFCDHLEKIRKSLDQIDRNGEVETVVVKIKKLPSYILGMFRRYLQDPGNDQLCEKLSNLLLDNGIDYEFVKVNLPAIERLFVADGDNNGAKTSERIKNLGAIVNLLLEYQFNKQVKKLIVVLKALENNSPVPQDAERMAKSFCNRHNLDWQFILKHKNEILGNFVRQAA